MMSKVTPIASRDFAKVMILGIVTVAATATTLGTSTPVLAATLTYAGVLTNPNSTPSFFFAADGISSVTFKSYSYSGGTSTNGTVFGGGGFNPILTIFGNLAGRSDQFLFEIDSLPLAQDFSATRSPSSLPQGNYRAVLSAAPNFAQGGSFAEGFNNINTSFGTNRTGFYAFDITNVTTPTAVPEPASIIGTVVAGLAVVGWKRKLGKSSITPAKLTR